MDWTACKKKDMVKEIKRDDNLISSLLSSSEKKLKSNELLPLDDTTASSKLTLVYDALREILEALAIAKGFKIYNHECYCAFLNEIMREDRLSKKFDDFRKLRNAVNYYGKDIKADETKSVLEAMFKLIKQVKGILNSMRKGSKNN